VIYHSDIESIIKTNELADPSKLSLFDKSAVIYLETLGEGDG